NDGVVPSNEGRGYVLRKIMRRGIYHGRVLGAQGQFLFEMVRSVAELMRQAYPELTESLPRILETVRGEENRFTRVLDVGLPRWEQDIRQMFSLAPESAEHSDLAREIYVAR